MNLATVTGVVLVAIGTFVMIWGQMAQSRKDSKAVEEKLDSVREDIHNAARKSGPEKDVALDSIEQNLNRWAEKFVTSRSETRLAIAQTRLALDQQQIDRSKRMHPLYSTVLTTLSSSCRAYSEKTGTPIVVTLPPLPENLVADGATYSGRIEFSPTLRWTVKLLAIGPQAVYLTLNLEDDAHKVPGTFAAVMPTEDCKEATITFYGDFPRKHAGPVHLKLNGDMRPLIDATRDVLEAQLASL